MSPPSFLDGCALATLALSGDHRISSQYFQHHSDGQHPRSLTGCAPASLPLSVPGSAVQLSPSQSFKSPYSQIQAPFLLDLLSFSSSSAPVALPTAPLLSALFPKPSLAPANSSPRTPVLVSAARAPPSSASARGCLSRRLRFVRGRPASPPALSSPAKLGG